ncbi:MAG: hypothetical protein ACOYN3_06520 [Acidimicrobiia bacterium]
MLDGLEIPYVIGGSVASSMFGEPRSTLNIDVALDVAAGQREALLEALTIAFSVPIQAARRALDMHESFNVLDETTGFKIDLFILGDGLLDRLQIERRVAVALPGSEEPVWVTSPADQILHKITWWRVGGRASDRQWRDICGLLSVSHREVDVDDLRAIATDLGIIDDLERAILESEL